MNNLEAAGRLVLWAIELSEFVVQYRPRTAIKAQALADFIAKFTTGKDKDEKLKVWMIWTDDLSNQWVGGVGVLLRLPEGDTVECVVCL